MGYIPQVKEGGFLIYWTDSSGMKRGCETRAVNFLLEEIACSMVRRTVTEIRQGRYSLMSPVFY